jgi:hypothetical protein
MVMVGKVRDEVKAAGTEPSKYVRYTAEQVEVLERIYNECPKPSSSRRQQIIRDHQILWNIEQKQLKVWFQNRRYTYIIKKHMYRRPNNSSLILGWMDSTNMNGILDSKFICLCMYDAYKPRIYVCM